MSGNVSNLEKKLINAKTAKDALTLDLSYLPNSNNGRLPIVGEISKINRKIKELTTQIQNANRVAAAQAEANRVAAAQAEANRAAAASAAAQAEANRVAAAQAAAQAEVNRAAATAASINPFGAQPSAAATPAVLSRKGFTSTPRPLASSVAVNAPQEKIISVTKNKNNRFSARILDYHNQRELGRVIDAASSALSGATQVTSGMVFGGRRRHKRTHKRAHKRTHKRTHKRAHKHRTHRR